MLDERTIGNLAERLQKCEDEKQFIRMFSIDHPGMTIEGAYAIQRGWTAIKLARGRVPTALCIAREVRPILEPFTLHCWP